MNKMCEIYGVVNMILFPEDEDPEMLLLETADFLDTIKIKLWRLKI